MSEFLSTLQKAKGSKSKGKRVGRGYGSGKGGHTSGKGNKGQNARSGGKRPEWYEGGQTPLTKRMPYHRGFINHNAKNVVSVNISNCESLFEKHKKVNPRLLIENKIIFDEKAQIKILGRGQVKSKIDFEGFVYSEKAKSKIESAGGTAL